MADNKTATVVLKYSIDRQSISQVVSANTAVKRELDGLNNDAAAVGREIQDAFRDTSADALTRRIREAGGEIRDAREEADSLRESLQGAGAAANNIRVPPANGGRGAPPAASSAGDLAGNFESPLSAVAGAAGAVSPELGGLLQGGADIAGALEGLGRIPSAMAKVGEAATELPGILGAAAQAGTGLAGVIPGITGGMGAFLAVAAPLAIAAAAAAAAIALVAGSITAAGDAAREAAEANTEEAARQNEIERLIAAGDTDTIQQRIAEAQRAYDDASDAFAANAADAAEATRQQQEALNGFNLIGVAQTGAAISAFNQGAEKNAEAMAEAQAELDAYTQALGLAAENSTEATQSQQELAVALEQATQATLSAINQRINDELEYARLSESASAESIQQRIEENQLRQQLIEQEIASLEALAAAGDTVAQQALPELRQQLEGLRADTERLSGDVLSSAQARERQEASTQAAEDAAKAAEEAERNRQRATEESANAVAQSEDKINQIRQDAAQKAIDLARQREDSIRKATEDADKAFRELAKKNNKAIDDENKRYKEGEAKAVEQYRRDELKSQQQHQKDRLRAQQDLQDSLLSAEEDNDVIAFIRAKRSGDEQLKRMDEDAQEETRIRGEQFAQERADAAAAHAEKLEQIKQATIEERDAIMARKDEAIAAANAQFDEQSRRLQEQTQQAIAREREQLQRSLENIRQKYNVEQTAGRQAAETIKQAFLAAAQAVKSQVDAAGKGGGKGGWDTSDKGFGDKGGSKGGSDKGFGDKGGGSKGGGKGNSSFGQVGGKKKGFAEGGIVPAGREVIGRFEPNRSYPEAVLPLDPATIERVFAGVFGGRGGGSNITVNVGNVTVPESSGVTIQDVKVAVETGVYAALEGINEARAGA